MYTSKDFKSKKDFKLAVLNGEKITVYNPGLGDEPGPNDNVTVCGPHAPKAHTWYAQCELRNGIVFNVK